MLVVVLSRLKSISFSLEHGHSQRSSVNSADYRCNKRLLEDEEEELKDLNKSPPTPTPTAATTITSPIPFKFLHKNNKNSDLRWFSEPETCKGLRCKL